jgi:hypothetical protein
MRRLLLGKEMAEEIHAILMTGAAYPILTSRAQTRIRVARTHWRDILALSQIPHQKDWSGVGFARFSGDQEAQLLAERLFDIEGLQNWLEPCLSVDTTVSTFTFCCT